MSKISVIARTIQINRTRPSHKTQIIANLNDITLLDIRCPWAASHDCKYTIKLWSSSVKHTGSTSLQQKLLSYYLQLKIEKNSTQPPSLLKHIKSIWQHPHHHQSWSFNAQTNSKQTCLNFFRAFSKNSLRSLQEKYNTIIQTAHETQTYLRNSSLATSHSRNTHTATPDNRKTWLTALNRLQEHYDESSSIT